MVSQVIQPLLTAHQMGIMHRDIKPSNILLDRGGNAYLADFGVATDPDPNNPQTQIQGVIGTRDYMSPQMQQGFKIEPSDEVYSLGVTIYRMLTGQHPRNIPEADVFRYVPKHMIWPLYHAMRSRREDRYPSLTVFWQAFDQAAKQPYQAPERDPLTLGRVTPLAGGAVSNRYTEFAPSGTLPTDPKDTVKPITTPAFTQPQNRKWVVPTVIVTVVGIVATVLLLILLAGDPAGIVNTPTAIALAGTITPTDSPTASVTAEAITTVTEEATEEVTGALAQATTLTASFAPSATATTTATRRVASLTPVAPISTTRALQRAGSPTRPPTSDNIYVVTGLTGGVNIREGDSTNFDAVTVLYPGQQAQALGISDRGTGWVYVELNGTRGWLSSFNVDIVGDSNQLPDVSPPTLMGSVSVTSAPMDSPSVTAQVQAQPPTLPANTGATIAAACSGFAITYPYDGVAFNKFSLLGVNWTALQGATSYRLVIRNADEWQNIFVDQLHVNQTSSSVLLDKAGAFRFAFTVTATLSNGTVCEAGIVAPHQS